MPHKRRRKAGDDDRAPSARRTRPINGAGPSKNGANHQASSTYAHDDTPKEFLRLMQRQQTRGQRKEVPTQQPSKKRKRSEVAETPRVDIKHDTSQSIGTQPAIKILPGEKLSEFAARVDRSLPVSGLANKGRTALAPKGRQTKTEKRLHKMYAAWREEDARIKDKLEEERELAEEEEDEDVTRLPENDPPKGKGKKRKTRMIGEIIDDKEDDPWLALKSTRSEPRHLHDVAQAPPEFKAVPKEKFKTRGSNMSTVANVPRGAGSLKRREDLGAARKDIIEQYRSRMARAGGD